MSILVEIAEKADVSVEGVVRVLTREPVSDAVKDRVLDVLDDLTPEQTRAVQRFALAALHDVLGRPGDPMAADGPGEPPDQLALALPEPALEPTPAVTGSDAALVQLSSVLGELAEAVRDLRRETDAERRERVDDLAVLIDLITTGWQGLDSRLGRIERQVSRLDTGRREFAPPRAAVHVPPPVRAPATPADAEPAVAPPPPARRARRDRLPLAGALSFAAAGIITLAVLQLASGGADVESLVSSREATTEGPAAKPAVTEPAVTEPAVTRPAVTAPTQRTTRPPAAKPPAGATTSSVLGTTVGRPTPPRQSATTAPRPKPLVPAITQSTTSAPAPSAFRPTRNWAWAPVQGADYYSVEFRKGGAPLYRATPSEPRVTLPSSVVFRPGSYRWVVRPGFGERAAGKLGAPVVDSPFTVAG